MYHFYITICCDSRVFMTKHNKKISQQTFMTSIFRPFTHLSTEQDSLTRRPNRLQFYTCIAMSLVSRMRLTRAGSEGECGSQRVGSGRDSEAESSSTCSMWKDERTISFSEANGMQIQEAESFSNGNMCKDEDLFEEANNNSDMRVCSF